LKDEAEEAAEKKIKIKKREEKRKRARKNRFFFVFFSKLPKKRCPGRRRLHPQRPHCVFEEDEAEAVA